MLKLCSHSSVILSMVLFPWLPWRSTYAHCRFKNQLNWVLPMSELSNKSATNYCWAQAGLPVPRGVLPSVSVLAFWGLCCATKIHCSHILRDICSLLVSIVLIWLYTQAICASSTHVCSEVSTLNNHIILELSNWKRVIMYGAISVSWLISLAVIWFCLSVLRWPLTQKVSELFFKSSPGFCEYHCERVLQLWSICYSPL